MKEQLVSQELYDLLKEKGYDIPDKQNECPGEMLINKSVDYLGYVLPTLSLAVQWIRECHNISITALPFRETNESEEESVSFCWYYSLIDMNTDYDILCNEDDLGTARSNFYDTFEEALEEGLKQGLTLIEI